MYLHVRRDQVRNICKGYSKNKCCYGIIVLGRVQKAMVEEELAEMMSTLKKERSCTGMEL